MILIILNDQVIKIKLKKIRVLDLFIALWLFRIINSIHNLKFYHFFIFFNYLFLFCFEIMNLCRFSLTISILLLIFSNCIILWKYISSTDKLNYILTIYLSNIEFRIFFILFCFWLWYFDFIYFEWKSLRFLCELEINQ